MPWPSTRGRRANGYESDQRVVDKAESPCVKAAHDPPLTTRALHVSLVGSQAHLGHRKRMRRRTWFEAVASVQRPGR